MQAILRTILLPALLSLSMSFCFAQTQNNDSLTLVVKEIAGSNIYEMSYTVGFAGMVSKQYLRFQKLLSLATEQQLTDLASYDRNAVVRLYAFQALKQKQANISGDLLQKFQHDDTEVTTLTGCIGSRKKVSELAKASLVFAVNFVEQ